MVCVWGDAPRRQTLGTISAGRRAEAILTPRFPYCIKHFFLLQPLPEQNNGNIGLLTSPVSVSLFYPIVLWPELGIGALIHTFSRFDPPSTLGNKSYIVAVMSRRNICSIMWKNL